MAFDSTLSGSNANSYIPVATADDYFTFHLDGTSYWTSLSTAQKQAALVQATNRIDMEMFGGRPTVDNQRLQWPRTWIIDRNMNPQDQVQDAGGRYYRPNNTIPKELADATCEMALNYLKIQNGDYTVDENDLETLSTYKIGPIDVSIKDNLKADRLPTKVKVLLQAIGPNAWSGNAPITYER